MTQKREIIQNQTLKLWLRIMLRNKMLKNLKRMGKQLKNKYLKNQNRIGDNKIWMRMKDLNNSKIGWGKCNQESNSNKNN